MGSPRIRPLTAADIPSLPEPCVSCTFWEAGLANLVTPRDPVDRTAVKVAWAEEVTAHWGYCGLMAVNDGEIIGFLTMAPAMFVPRLRTFATTQVSQDAALLMTVHVVEEFADKGIGRQLVQAAAATVAKRDIRALEAVGTYRTQPSCMLPVSWLESVGFAVVRNHPLTPRLRMDLHSTVRWRPDLEAAWHRLTGLVSQPAPPEPAGFEPAHRDTLVAARS